MVSLAETPMVKKMGGGAQTAEEHRDGARHAGLIGSIATGWADLSQIPRPWPTDTPGETAKLNTYLDQLERFCNQVPRPIREGHVDMGLDLIKQMAELGLFALKVPATPWAGLEFTHSSYVAILGFLTTHFPAALIMVSAHNTIGGLYPVLKYGDEAQQREWMPTLCKWPSAFCFTEDKVGSDPARMESHATAIWDEDGAICGYRLTGTKYYATNSAYATGRPLARLLAVIARIVNDPEKEIFRWSRLDPRSRRLVKRAESERLQDTVAAGDRRAAEYDSGLRYRYGCFIVPTDIAGVEVVQRTEFEGMDGIFNGILRFEGVRLTPHHLIKGKDGFKIALESLTNGRFAIAGGCVAAAKRDIAGMTWYAAGREQWEQLIIDKEMIGSGMIAPAIADTFACEALTRYTAARADAKLDIRLEAAIVKVAAAQVQHRVVRDLNTIVGGRAFEKWQSLSQREECVPSFQWMRNSWPCETFEGSKQILTLWSEREMDDDLIQDGLAFKTGGWWAKLKITGKMCWQYLIHGMLAKLPAWGDVSFITRTAHRLRQAKIWLLFRHQNILLERMQLQQQRLVGVVTELALMAAAIRYAEHLDHGLADPRYRGLADCYCRGARLRIAEYFRQLWDNSDGLARSVLVSHRAGWYDNFLTNRVAPLDQLLVPRTSAASQAATLTAARGFTTID